MVQFYTDDIPLTEGVTQYLIEGMRLGERGIVIATADHCAAIRRALEKNGLDVDGAVYNRRLLFCDAGEILNRFMIDGQPDRGGFDAAVGTLVRDLSTPTSGGRLRAYGEMVDLLWNAGHSAAAMRLEGFWNELLDATGVSLTCAYQIDIFGREFQAGVLDHLLRTHTHLLPTASNDELRDALNTALHEVVGSQNDGLQLSIYANLRPSWGAIPPAEATVLWLRSNLPDYVDEIISRAKSHYQAALATPATR
jgi:MEDS: MEthanogen/methylotroph, DcmR Sensory domain